VSENGIQDSAFEVAAKSIAPQDIRPFVDFDWPSISISLVFQPWLRLPPSPGRGAEFFRSAARSYDMTRLAMNEASSAFNMSGRSTASAFPGVARDTAICGVFGLGEVERPRRSETMFSAGSVGPGYRCNGRA
jgi:hypothetical protein